MDIKIILTLLTGLGIGSALTTLVQHLLQKKNSVFESQRGDLEKRYKVIILLMYAAFEFEDNKAILRISRPDLENKRDVLNELKAEWYNMMLFASAATQGNLHAFINNANVENLTNTAISMRKDLGRNAIDSSLHKLRFQD